MGGKSERLRKLAEEQWAQGKTVFIVSPGDLPLSPVQREEPIHAQDTFDEMAYLTPEQLEYILGYEFRFDVVVEPAGNSYIRKPQLEEDKPGHWSAPHGK